MTIEKAREILGKEAEGLSDEEVLENISTAQLLADMAIDSFLNLSPKEREKFKK